MRSRIAALTFPAQLLVFAVTLSVASRASAQILTTLYTFTGAGDGSFPYGGLLSDQSGNLYGTTIFGGASRDGRPTIYGTVFELSPSSSGWTVTTLHQFQGGPDGYGPLSGVIADKTGNLYGTTTGGLSVSELFHGTVFQIVPPTASGGAWTENVLYRFHGPDGSNPTGRLVADASGNLYGATSIGGSCGWGVIYRLSPPAVQGEAWKENVLLDFADAQCLNATKGFRPNGVTLGSDGALYGTTFGGGPLDLGIVFRLRPPAQGQSNWTRTCSTVSLAATAERLHTAM